MRTLPAKLLSTTVIVAVIGLLQTPAMAQSNELLLEELRRISARMEVLEAKVEAAENRATAAEAKTRAIEQQVNSAAPAAPSLVTSGKAGVRLSLSGQVNRGLLYYDDGDDTDVRNVDNDNSSTRIRLIGEVDVTDELTVGSNIEVQFESNSSSDVQQGDDGSVIGSNSFTERKLEVYFDHDEYGKLSLGQGDTASNGTSEVDLSGTSLVGYSSIADVGGSLLFRDSDTGALSGIEIGSAFSNFDGLSRDDRIRYDTPKLNGFVASASLADDEVYDVALRYNNTYSGFRVASAIAFADRPNDVEQFNGSLSVLHADSGISLTGAAGTRRLAGSDPYFVYGKLGYQRNWFDFGKTALSADVYYGEDIGANGRESMSFGVQAVQNISSVGTELYLSGRFVDVDTPGQNLDGIFTTFGGARVKF